MKEELFSALKMARDMVLPISKVEEKNLEKIDAIIARYTDSLK